MAPAATKSLRERARLTLGYLRNAPRVIGLLRDSSPAFAAGLLAVLVGQALVPGAMAWVGKLIVDAVVLAAKSGTSPAGEDARRQVMSLVAIEFALVVLQTLLSRAQTLLRELLRATLGNHVNTLILEKATTLERSGVAEIKPAEVQRAESAATAVSPSSAAASETVSASMIKPV